MELKRIELNIDKLQEIYNTSADCQMLLNVYDEYYPKIGYNLPWVGYFVVRIWAYCRLVRIYGL